MQRRDEIIKHNTSLFLHISHFIRERGHTMKRNQIQTQLTIAVFAIAAAGMEALFALCLGKTFDVIEMKRLDYLITLLAAVVILTVADSVLCVWMRSLAHRNASQQVHTLKKRIYSSQMRRTRRENPDTAEFTSKIDLLFQDYYMGKQFVLIYGATSLCACAAIIWIHWSIFLVALVSASLPFLVPAVFQKTVQKAASEYADESTVYIGFVTNTLYGRMELIKYRAAAKYMEKHGMIDRQMETKRVKSLNRNYIAEKSAETVANFMQAGVLLTGGILVYHSLITVGNVVSVVQLMGSMVFPLTAAINYMNRVNSCKPVLKALEEASAEFEPEEPFEVQSAGDDKAFKNEILLCAEHVTYDYPGEAHTVINDFSYCFERGKKYLLKGESGSGKTTLARLLSGELSPTSGSIRMKGKNMCEMAPEQRSRLCNYSEQKSYLFLDDVLHNITLYRDCDQESEQKLRAAMDMLQLENIKMDAQISDNDGISGGEKSRICLLRAMYDMPEVLIADEPTGALDEKNTEKVIRYLLDCKETVIVIAHNLSEEIEQKFDEIIRT